MLLHPGLSGLAMALVWGEGPVALQRSRDTSCRTVVSICSHDPYGPLQLTFHFSSAAAAQLRQMILILTVT